jgi:hypothetical protein
MSFLMDIRPVTSIVAAEGRHDMRLARILVATWLVLGGITACSDHNPTVIFTADAGADAKTEAGTSHDGGSSHDGGTDVVTAKDDGPASDVLVPVDLAPEASPAIDVASLPDAGSDRAVDQAQALDGAAPTDSNRAERDGAGPALDGPAGTAPEVGIDSSAVHDGGGTAG